MQFASSINGNIEFNKRKKISYIYSSSGIALLEKGGVLVQNHF